MHLFGLYYLKYRLFNYAKDFTHYFILYIYTVNKNSYLNVSTSVFQKAHKTAAERSKASPEWIKSDPLKHEEFLRKKKNKVLSHLLLTWHTGRKKMEHRTMDLTQRGGAKTCLGKCHLLSTTSQRADLILIRLRLVGSLADSYLKKSI